MSIHFIGIGGIGTSALARYFVLKGYQVSGSDATESEITKALAKEGVRIFVGHKEGNIKTSDLVIYSAAVAADNLELVKAKKLGLKVQSYAEALGELTKKYFTIAVSGSHGKSTTTALLSLVLVEAGFAPTVIVGTKLREFGDSNFRAGKSEYLVIESDEYNRSFHSYYPKIVVLTNVGKEHLDTYGGIAGVKIGFLKYLKNLSEDGIVFANWADRNSREVVNKSGRKTVFYNRGPFQKHNLKILGFHNQLNAEAVWQTARHLGIKRSLVEKVLSKYRGAWRRMEKIRPGKKTFQGFEIYSDYAHHPTEIQATLGGIRQKYPTRKIVCIFQPHQQDRLTRLYAEFKKCFPDADELILMPEYVVKGREGYLKKVKTSYELAVDLSKSLPQSRLNKLTYQKDFDGLEQVLSSRKYKKGTLLVFMGAGSIDNWAKKNL